MPPETTVIAYDCDDDTGFTVEYRHATSSAYVFLESGSRELRSEPVEAGNSLALAGDTLFVGSAGRVRAFNAHSGRKLWSEAVPGRALGLAVANGALLVSTDTGAIISFGQADDQPSAWILF